MAVPMKNLPAINKGQHVTLIGIIQPSRHHRIIYELRPQISVYYMGALVETNDKGWRGRGCSVNKEKNTDFCEFLVLRSFVELSSGDRKQ